jgi:hypothetical protein
MGMDALGEIKAGLVDGFDWNVHPVYFGYAAVLATTLWVIARLLLSVERLSGKEKPPTLRRRRMRGLTRRASRVARR